MLKELKQELRHGSLQLLLFVVAWLLPQRLHFRAFKAIAHLHPWLLNVKPSVKALIQHKPELASAQKSLGLGIALHQIIDQADCYLTRRFSARWLDDNCEITGPAPEKPPTGLPVPLFLTPHYGQGFWAIRYLNECCGFRLAWLYLPPAKHLKPGNILQSWTNKRRLAQIERLCSSLAIPTGGSIATMQEKLIRHGVSVLAMPDAPPQPGQSKVVVTLMEQQAFFPAGVFSLAEREKVPVYLYSILLDRQSGKRRMIIKGPYTGLGKDALAQHFADLLDDAIKQDPCAWHLWPYLEAFLHQ